MLLLCVWPIWLMKQLISTDLHSSRKDMAKISIYSLAFNSLEIFQRLCFLEGRGSSFSVFWGLFSLLLLRFQFAPPCSKSIFRLRLPELVTFLCIPPPSSFQVCFLVPQIRQDKGEGMNESSSSCSCYNSFLRRAMSTMWFLEGFINKFWSHTGSMFLPSRHICILININGSCKHWTENRPCSGKRHEDLVTHLGIVLCPRLGSWYFSYVVLVYPLYLVSFFLSF